MLIYFFVKSFDIINIGTIDNFELNPIKFVVKNCKNIKCRKVQISEFM